MNEVLAHERAQMPADKLARMQQLEQADLFGWRSLGEGAVHRRVRSLSLGWGYFPFLFWRAPRLKLRPESKRANELGTLSGNVGIAR